MNSNIDKDHKQKGSKRLNQFKVNNLDKSFIDTCRKTNLDAYTKYLRHIRVNNDTSGCIYTDKDKIVAILNTETKKNGMIWIQALEIAEEYQGYGLSKQLLLIATKKYNAKYLSVDKNNKVAIDIYEKFGFHEYHKTENMIFMCIGEPNEVEEAVFLSEGYFHTIQLSRLMGVKINGINAVSTSKRISILKAHKNDEYLNYINKCKNVEDLNFLRKDCNAIINSYTTIGPRIDKISKEGLTKETKIYYKSIYNDYVKHGITGKDCELFVKWCREVVLPAISARRKELVKNESCDILQESMQLSMFRKDVIKSKSSDKDDPYDKITIKYYSSNKIVATVTITKYDNGDNFIHDLEVYYPYKRQGLSYQILDVATKEYGGNCLFVKADNKIAIHVYEKYGFKKTNENYEGKKDGLKGYVMRLSSTVNEGYIFDSKIVKYQVEEFESGKVKTLFVTGMSGSGKSTLGHKYEKDLGINCYELDDIGFNDKFTDDNLKEYGKEIYDWFKGPGKKYRMDPDRYRESLNNPDIKLDYKEYDWDLDEACADFIKYILSKNARCIVEGIEIFMCLDSKLLNIEQFKNSAMIVMGTSAAKSTYRALKRDYENDKKEDPSIKLKDAIPFDYLKNRIKYALQDEKALKELRNKIKNIKK